jgi:hypothetical protein
MTPRARTHRRSLRGSFSLRVGCSLRGGFSLLEAIVGVAIATAFLGAIALFTTNLGDSRARLARTSREIDCAEAVFTALERACATAVVAANGGAGIEGNESSVRIVRSAVGLGNDGQPVFGELSATAVSFDAGARRVSVARGTTRDALSAPVRALRIRYLAEDGWQDAFDSTDGGAFPVGIEVSIWFDRSNGDARADADADGASMTEPAIDAPADRTRFLRVTGGPRVDPLAIRRIEDDRGSSSRGQTRDRNDGPARGRGSDATRGGARR